MDLKKHYHRIREISASLPDDSIVLVSRATPDGGRPGCYVETTREVAARMIADGTAELASEADAARFREEARQQQAEEERRRAAARIQVSVITEEQARKLKPRSTS